MVYMSAVDGCLGVSRFFFYCFSGVLCLNVCECVKLGASLCGGQDTV